MCCQLTSVNALITCSPITFHAFVFFVYDSSYDRNRIHVELVVDQLSSPVKSGLRCNVELDYNYRANSNHREYSGVWHLSTQLASVSSQAVFAMAVPKDGLSTNYSIQMTQVEVTFEPVGTISPHAAPIAIQRLRTNALLATIDDINLCDCSLLPNNAHAKPIFVSRAVLAHASPFFVTMFNGPWGDAVKQDKLIEFGWTVTAMIPSLIHIYSGWVPGQPLPPGQSVTDLLAKHALDIAALSLHQWLELMDLAQMLELPLLVHAVNKEMVKVLKVQLVKVSDEVTQLCNKVKALEVGSESEE